MEFIPVKLHLQKGDVITSKKGVLQKSVATDKYYRAYKLRFVDKDIFEIMSEKEEIDIEEVEE